MLRELPAGSIELATAYLRRGLAAAGATFGGVERASRIAEEHFVAPLLLEQDWPHPSVPLPVADGFVHADLTDDDHELLARLRSHLGEQHGELDPETLASAAQEWRLAVTPYRPSGHSRGDPEPTPASSMGSLPPAVASGPRRPRAAVKASQPLVIDLSALWAGPLATSLLAEGGARVIKIDSDARPDGLRDHSSMYHHLNAGKEIVDLDLRRAEDRARFEALLASADLVIDSFSRRVMPNFGYGSESLRFRFPHLAMLSIVAFPCSAPERDWISYGPGVHAASGLAVRSDGGGFRPASIAYPDAMAGLQAFAVAAEMLNRTTDERRAEVSLAGAIAPLGAPSPSAPSSTADGHR